MPALAPRIFVDVILDAIQQSGGSGIYTARSDRVHPRTFLINYGEQAFSLWAYIWTVTHGGRENLPDEYRIQMTSVNSPLALNPDPEGYTALLGYYPDLKVFAGFDLRRHKKFTTGSPSVQIDISAMRDALQSGLGFSTKDNREVAVGIRPDQLVTYITNAEALHKYGADARMLKLLRRATEIEKIEKKDIRGLASDRQKIIASISRYSRDANFRKKVLSAYDNRCAVTRAQLKLVDAAHILPVPSEESSDHVTNGIALSPTIHRAFDNGLIYVDERYMMRLNEEKVGELKAVNLDAGLDKLISFLDTKVHLPADRAQRPNTQYIRKGNKYRRIPGYY